MKKKSKILEAALVLFYAFSTDMPRDLVPEFQSAMQLLEVDTFAYACDTVLMKTITDAMAVPSTKPKSSRLFWELFDNDDVYEDFPQVGLVKSNMIHRIEQYAECNIYPQFLNIPY